jgi:phosphoenolpyruvate synthase/pyruvate phosphate dikinase
MGQQNVIQLADAADVALSGGKAAALGRLIKATFRVPDGFVVSSQSFDTMTTGLEKCILQAFDELQTEYVAVRSSAVNEDGHDAAWAGQLDTFLNVTRADLIARIKACWHSAGSERAQAYARQKNLEIGPVAVLVQAMIQSDVSGVAFSVHPVTQDADNIVIEAGLGLGEAIVAGEITPDTYITNKSTHTIVQKYISSQTKLLAQSKAGKTVWHKTGHAGQEQKLTDKQIGELSGIIARLEVYFGYPIDAEWSLKNDVFYVLQARPITTLI